MCDKLYPSDEIWDKFGIPNAYSWSHTVFAVAGMMERPQVVPSHVMAGRHDCMWSGTCSSGKHQKQCYVIEPVVAVTVTVRPVKSSRSLLRTNRAKAPTTSPRPETPSESEEDESPVCGTVCDNEDLSVAVSVSEVTGQVMRTRSEFKTLSPPPSPVPAFYTDHSYHISKSPVMLDRLGVQTPSDSAGKGRWGSSKDPEFTYPDSPVSWEFEERRASTRRRKTRSFYDSLACDGSTRPHGRNERKKPKGNPSGRKPENPVEVECQTPYYNQSPPILEVCDDEEEEIDVVSVADRDRLAGLPTNPSARDRQHLQRTVASAIHHGASRGHKRCAPDHEKRTYKRRRSRKDEEEEEEEDDSSDRRNQHNDMERKRRVDMRDAISVLRSLVPAVADNERAAKVLILNEAAAYCRQLGTEGERVSRLSEELYRRQRELSAHLKELRFQNAKMRGNVEKSPRKKRMGSRSRTATHQRRLAATQWMFAARRKRQKLALECRKNEKFALEHRNNQRFCSKPR
ncbi:uncharacterized protein LOC110831645 isoform X3 [Zootermopsis nevadensis]|uniref:uncharacterized protein LOC110831645 isoform X3 n=1 Tax=Zootermopsis nevadensis TaxID=136037 RepID=UPI000B8EB8AC|nr:uncharacterized protein LOC110831645 isoform X3 [Zootermopsis nevadensis]